MSDCKVYVTNISFVTYTHKEGLLADLKALTAEELMLRYQTHSPEEAYLAFNELYNRYSQRVFNFLNAKLKNSADCEDLLQKIFIKIHESKHLYKDKFKFEQWLFVIARTQMMDFFRAKKRYENKLANSKPDFLNEKNLDIDLTPLESLDRDQLELLEMKFIDEMSYLEISKLVNKSEVSLRKTVSRIMARMKRGEAL